MATTTINPQTLTNDAGDNLTGTIWTNEQLQQLLTNINALFAVAVEWGGVQTAPTQPRSQAFHNATQSINDSTLTALSFNTEDYDVGAMHDPVTNNSRMTVPTGAGGLYLVIAKVTFAASAGGTARVVRFRKNGADVGSEILRAPTNAVAETHGISANVSAVAGDYFEVFVFQDSGGALNVGNATRIQCNEFSVAKLW